MISCLILISNSYANKFVIGFYQNDGYNKYCIEYNGIWYSTNNIEDFSKALKNLSKDYFEFSSVIVNNITKTTKFDEFYGVNNKDYDLYFSGNAKSELNVILNYRLNNTEFPNSIVENINSLKVYSSSWNKLKSNITKNITIDINDLDKIFLNDDLIPLKYCNLIINNTQITDIKAVSNITKKLLYNTNPESIMDIIYFNMVRYESPIKMDRTFEIK